ncbi:MAG TPA: hypothetical protein VK034_19790 [Enhygromyxa sp.]|nr:hypothetical protein [Enhygromyxa sp.]
MTSPDPKSTPQSAGEGGGMLPALLAGAGILLVAGLFIFGGDDEKAAGEAKDSKTATAQTAKGRSGGVGSRPTDGANPNQARPKLNPRIANAVVTEGMSPLPNKEPEPTSFASPAEEIAYWEKQLLTAQKNLELRQHNADYAPSAEAKMRENGTPEEIEQFQRRLEIVADNLEKAKVRVAEIEAKLEALRGG